MKMKTERQHKSSQNLESWMSAYIYDYGLFAIFFPLTPMIICWIFDCLQSQN